MRNLDNSDTRLEQTLPLPAKQAASVCRDAPGLWPHIFGTLPDMIFELNFDVAGEPGSGEKLLKSPELHRPFTKSDISFSSSVYVPLATQLPFSHKCSQSRKTFYCYPMLRTMYITLGVPEALPESRVVSLDTARCWHSGVKIGRG